jgi:Sensors of blue-light using FAD
MVCAQNSFQFLYVSRLASGCTWEVVKEIVATARFNNPSHGITGALLFDGERFCQLIEGAPDNVRELRANLMRDSRHTGMTVLLEEQSAAAPLTQRWASGYCDHHELEPLDSPNGLRGRPALDAFFTLLERADLE